MEIQTMHRLFMQLAQRMGMQNIRAIFPEQIDLMLNNSIVNIVNDIVQKSTNDKDGRTIDDTTTIQRFNALRTLLVTKSFVNVFNFGTYDRTKYAFILNSINDVTDGLIQANTKTVSGDKCYPFESMLYFIGLDISYGNTVKGYKYNFSNNMVENPDCSVSITYKANARIIRNAVIGETFNDHILAPTYKSPVVILNSMPNHVSGIDFDIKIFFGAMSHIDGIAFDFGGKVPRYISMTYIKTPAVVSLSGKVNCDLPELLHQTIVENAVKLYLETIGK